METSNRSLLTINGGSSSIKFAVYDIGERPHKRLAGKVDGLGQGEAKLSFTSDGVKATSDVHLDADNYAAAADALINWLQQQDAFTSLAAVGHRVVHGMKHAAPEVVTQQLINELRTLTPYDPEHLPGEIALIECVRRLCPDVPQVACFDTEFHRGMPKVATLLPIPRRYEAMGVRRYGFHGLSCAYLMEQLTQLGDPAALHGRVILAHLGSGASMSAVRDGHSIDTSMSFTPTAGLPMSTRSGDLDPGLVDFLARTEHMDAQRFARMVTHESGLLGMSETSSDMRQLLKIEANDVRAAEAVQVFCYQAKKCIGGFAAALGGLDTLVFAGGIGENMPTIRARICEGLNFLGIALNPSANATNDSVISAAGSPVSVRVIATDEEHMIATTVCQVLALATPGT